MRIYKPTFKAGKKTVESPTYYADFRQGPIRRRLPLFHHERESQRAAERIEHLMSMSSGPMDQELAAWVESIPAKMRDTLIAWGILKDGNTGKLLTEHIEDWRGHLKAKGSTDTHVQLISGRVHRVMDACGFKSWSDIDGQVTEQHLTALRDKGISAQTYCFYVQNLKQFGRWMVRNRRAVWSPFDNLQGVNVQTDRRHDRRALTADERTALLTTTAAGPVRLGMSGIDRY